MLADYLDPLRFRKALDGRFLSLDPQPGLPLSRRGNPVICDCGKHGSAPYSDAHTYYQGLMFGLLNSLTSIPCLEIDLGTDNMLYAIAQIVGV